MKYADRFDLSREKHLDHMVRVVPFIVFCYAIQSFAILKVSPGEFSSVSLSILGGFLACMISAFITYDLKHQVTFLEDHFEVKFFTLKKTVRYEDIWSIDIKDPGQSFSTLTFLTKDGKMSFFFVDEAEKIKKFIESKRDAELLRAA